MADKKTKMFNYYSSWPQSPQEREYIMTLSRARIADKYMPVFGMGQWTHRWIESQHHPDADQSGVFALHTVACLLRNVEPDDEPVPLGLRRWKSAPLAAETEARAGTREVIGCHAKAYSGKIEEVTKQGFGAETVPASMEISNGRGTEKLHDKRRPGSEKDGGPRKKRRRDNRTLSTIVVDCGS